MSRTIRRKQFSSKPFLFNNDYLDENGFITGRHNGRFHTMHINVANDKINAWYHSDAFCPYRSPGRGYRQTYRAKSSQQLRNQLNLDDYEGICIDEHCDGWRWW